MVWVFLPWIAGSLSVWRLHAAHMHHERTTAHCASERDYDRNSNDDVAAGSWFMHADVRLLTAATLVILFVASRERRRLTRRPLSALFHPLRLLSNEASRFVWLSGDRGAFWRRATGGYLCGSSVWWQPKIARLFQPPRTAASLPGGHMCRKGKKKIPKITKLSSNISLLRLLIFSVGRIST